MSRYSGGFSHVVRLNPTITAGAYSADDVVGGELTITGAMGRPNGTGRLQTLWVHDADSEAAELEFYFFNSAPANADADNAAFTWTAGDEDIFLGKVTVASSDYVARGGDSFAVLSDLAMPMKAIGNGRDLYCYVVCTNAPTYTATTDLTFGFGFLLDG